MWGMGEPYERHIANLRQIAANLRDSDQSKVIQPVRDHWAKLLDEAAEELDGLAMALIDSLERAE